MIPFFGKKNKNYDYEKIFTLLLDQVTNFEDSSENIEALLKVIFGVVGAEGGSFFLFQKEKNLFVLSKWINQKPLHLSISGDYEFLHYLKQVKKVVFKDELVQENRFVDIRQSGINFFTQLSCCAVVSLFIKNQFVGLLNFGRRPGLEAYGIDDKTIMLMMGYWLAHTISNTELLGQVVSQNKKLAELSQLKNQMIGNVSHELRTPLNGILGLTDLILEGADGYINDDQKRHLEMIKASGESLLEIVNNILSLVKAESSKGDMLVKKINLGSVMREVLALFEGILATSENCVEFDAGNKLVVFGDEDQVRTVLMNLIGNAIKFTRKGQIKITTFKSGEMIKVCVSDTGIGISEADQEKIFDEFWQASPGPTRNFNGTGLGLSIAKKIIARHGGRLWVESKLNQGSHFFFTLPSRPARIELEESR